MSESRHEHDCPDCGHPAHEDRAWCDEPQDPAIEGNGLPRVCKCRFGAESRAQVGAANKCQACNPSEPPCAPALAPSGCDPCAEVAELKAALEMQREAMRCCVDEENRLRRKLRALGEAYRRRREHHARECADLYGYGAFIGPCAHGRDPWDRCDECGEGTALAAAANAVAAAWLRERDLERLLGDALPWVEHGTDSCACGESGCDHRARLVARIAAALAAGARKDGT